MLSIAATLMALGSPGLEAQAIPRSRLAPAARAASPVVIERSHGRIVRAYLGAGHGRSFALRGGRYVPQRSATRDGLKRFLDRVSLQGVFRAEGRSMRLRARDGMILIEPLGGAAGRSSSRRAYSIGFVNYDLVRKDYFVFAQTGSGRTPGQPGGSAGRRLRTTHNSTLLLYALRSQGNRRAARLLIDGHPRELRGPRLRRGATALPAHHAPLDHDHSSEIGAAGWSLVQGATQLLAIRALAQRTPLPPSDPQGKLLAQMALISMSRLHNAQLGLTAAEVGPALLLLGSLPANLSDEEQSGSRCPHCGVDTSSWNLRNWKLSYLLGLVWAVPSYAYDILDGMADLYKMLMDLNGEMLSTSGGAYLAAFEELDPQIILHFFRENHALYKKMAHALFDPRNADQLLAILKQVPEGMFHNLIQAFSKDATVPSCLACLGEIHGKGLLDLLMFFTVAEQLTKAGLKLTGWARDLWEFVRGVLRGVDDLPDDLARAVREGLKPGAADEAGGTAGKDAVVGKGADKRIATDSRQAGVTRSPNGPSDGLGGLEDFSRRHFGRGVAEQISTAEGRQALIRRGHEAGIDRSRWPVPPLPEGMSKLPEFAAVMRWGTGSDTARARIATLTLEDLRKAGVTPATARAWRDFYINEAIRSPQNPSAAGRADLMGHALDLLLSADRTGSLLPTGSAGRIGAAAPDASQAAKMAEALRRSMSAFPRGRIARLRHRVESLLRLGLGRLDLRRFFEGRLVRLQLPIQGGPPIDGFARLVAGELQVGIHSIKAEGFGPQAFAEFLTRAGELARALGFRRVKVIGAELINSDLKRKLLDLGFTDGGKMAMPNGGVVPTLVREFEADQLTLRKLIKLLIEKRRARRAGETGAASAGPPAGASGSQVRYEGLLQAGDTAVRVETDGRSIRIWTPGSDGRAEVYRTFLFHPAGRGNAVAVARATGMPILWLPGLAGTAGRSSLHRPDGTTVEVRGSSRPGAADANRELALMLTPSDPTSSHPSRKVSGNQPAGDSPGAAWQPWVPTGKNSTLHAALAGRRDGGARPSRQEGVGSGPGVQRRPGEQGPAGIPVGQPQPQQGQGGQQNQGWPDAPIFDTLTILHHERVTIDLPGFQGEMWGHEVQKPNASVVLVRQHRTGKSSGKSQLTIRGMKLGEALLKAGAVWRNSKLGLPRTGSLPASRMYRIQVVPHKKGVSAYLPAGSTRDVLLPPELLLAPRNMRGLRLTHPGNPGIARVVVEAAANQLNIEALAPGISSATARFQMRVGNTGSWAEVDLSIWIKVLSVPERAAPQEEGGSSLGTVPRSSSELISPPVMTDTPSITRARPSGIIFAPPTLLVGASELGRTPTPGTDENQGGGAAPDPGPQAEPEVRIVDVLIGRSITLLSGTLRDLPPEVLPAMVTQQGSASVVSGVSHVGIERSSLEYGRKFRLTVEGRSPGAGTILAKFLQDRAVGGVRKRFLISVTVRVEAELIGSPVGDTVRIVEGGPSLTRGIDARAMNLMVLHNNYQQVARVAIDGRTLRIQGVKVGTAFVQLSYDRLKPESGRTILATGVLHRLLVIVSKAPQDGGPATEPQTPSTGGSTVPPHVAQAQQAQQAAQYSMPLNGNSTPSSPSSSFRMFGPRLSPQTVGAALDAGLFGFGFSLGR